MIDRGGEIPAYEETPAAGTPYEPLPNPRARSPLQSARLAAEASLAADAMLRAIQYLERQDGFEFQGQSSPLTRAAELRIRRNALLAAALAVRS